MYLLTLKSNLKSKLRVKLQKRQRENKNRDKIIDLVILQHDDYNLIITINPGSISTLLSFLLQNPAAICTYIYFFLRLGYMKTYLQLFVNLVYILPLDSTKRPGHSKGKRLGS